MSVVIYTKKDHCPYCDRAKNILKRANLTFEEIVVGSQEGIDQMNEAVGKPVRTFPQIIIDGDAIGGCDELLVLYKENKL